MIVVIGIGETVFRNKQTNGVNVVSLRLAFSKYSQGKKHIRIQITTDENIKSRRTVLWIHFYIWESYWCRDQDALNSLQLGACIKQQFQPTEQSGIDDVMLVVHFWCEAFKNRLVAFSFNDLRKNCFTEVRPREYCFFGKTGKKMIIQS